MFCCFVLLLEANTDGWVNSSWKVGVGLTHQHVLILYVAVFFLGQYGRLRGVIMVGWGETLKSTWFAVLCCLGVRKDG